MDKNISTTLPANSAQPEVWHDILEELRLLRHDLNMLLFQDDIENYENADEIQKAYKRAIKQHPPMKE